MFNNIYFGKKVVVTGNTGFKGSWLSLWLISLGAEVVGISKDIPTEPSLFKSAKIEDNIKHIYLDICEHDNLKKILLQEKPDFVFHLAAQAIVSSSFEDPITTLQTNAMGTLSVLEGIKSFQHKCIVIFITSDKCYENVEWCYGYRETDHLGGKDMYSSSKAAAEAVIHSHYHSYLKDKENITIGVARAGNVIGGGDWAKDRIVADCMRSWSENKELYIRSPEATRPWQHVLEPLSGYLQLGSFLDKSSELDGEPFNFGPKDSQNRTVLELINALQSNWTYSNEPKIKIKNNTTFYEASLLKLNCDKALMYLKWEPNLDFIQTTSFVASWYNNFFIKDEDVLSYTNKQIEKYSDIALKQGRDWTI
jgi:CDP-glucose 4,6-dehydratase